MTLKFLNPTLLALIVSVTFSCDEDLENKQELKSSEELNDKMLHTAFDGKIFSIPSPAQTSLLIKNLDVPFTAALINSNVDIEQYKTPQLQSLNIGILGANLGYAAMYNEKKIALDCYSRIYVLSSELKIQDAFDADIYEKYDTKHNINSLLKEMTDSYKETDDYLKKSNKKDVSALILTGGWVQSMYLLTNLANESQNKELIKRISEQKEPLHSLVEILKTYNTDDQNNDLITSLEELNVLFKQINTEYYYNSPETDKSQYTTTLNHTVKVEASKEVIDLITKKIAFIRNSITKL